VNLVGDSINTINKNTEIVTDASKDDGLEVNVEKRSNCWCLLTRMQVKSGHKKANKSKNVGFWDITPCCSCNNRGF
jgi:hypothetical protein